MRKTILDEFNENPEILTKNYNIKKLNAENDNSVEITNELLKELNIPKGNQNTLKFIFYELIGNIYDHSKFSDAYISGKSDNHYFDFIFADNGISIIDSFRNAKYSIDNDCDALIKAVNGLSTKNDFGYIERGTGLNNTTNIVVNGFDGEILIVSGRAALYMNSKTIIAKKIPKFCNGTKIHLRIDLNSKIDMYNYLNQIEYRL
ncbi:MAG: hypothetical protein U0L42_08370 [Methanobrevibacter sp.]|uniref:hypothetical protein n=1 Tax=Methanobrevibacter sp. TaxID=66852 RepID=UPI002E76F206|nr:hypothetical protein [Methanobrevibacter sp.]MEE0935673.1 hypothetical protein [Methanobrevibacter sp.]